MMGYVVLAGTVFGVNLLPAFGPPTWAVLVFFRFHSSLEAVPLVLVGALAAASGRLVLAFASSRFRDRLSPKRLENLEAARDVVAGGRKRALAGLGLFALSPLPSAQLFVAAGQVAAPIAPLTAAFFAGRLRVDWVRVPTRRQTGTKRDERRRSPGPRRPQSQQLTPASAGQDNAALISPTAPISEQRSNDRQFRVPQPPRGTCALLL